MAGEANLEDSSATVGVKDAAKIAKVHPETIRVWLRLGKLRSTRPGSTGRHKRGGAPHRIKLRDLHALLDIREEDLRAYESKEPTP